MSASQSLSSMIRGSLTELIRPGEGDVSGGALWRLGSVALAVVIVITNLIGAAAVLVLAEFVLPRVPVTHPDHVRLVNAFVAAGYVAVAVPLGVVLGTRGLWRLRAWLRSGRPPTPPETRLLLHAPLRLFVLQVSMWWLAALLFGLLDAQYSGELGLGVAATIVLTGIVTASCAYLLTERLLRSPAARALADGSPGRLAVPGITTRALLAWALGTGVPVLGLVILGILDLAHARGVDRTNIGVSMIVLGGASLSVGLLAVTLAARTTADPIASLRRALARVQTGDFDVRVPVYDGTQIGQLQLGFNEMVAGLAERERIRSAFGTYVDPDVAAHILKEGIDMAGEQVEVTIMFIDVRDFTGFAERTPAPEVVNAINRLFERIVPVIHTHDGRIDKYVGDGLMAVFGAPRRLTDHADKGLAAALEIAEAVRSGDAGPLEIGIGLNSGTVVAGNIGGDERFEFSVIGDPVNVAARVEAATRQTGDQVLVADRTVGLLHERPARLVEREKIELKGKRDTVRVFAPVIESSHPRKERSLP